MKVVFRILALWAALLALAWLLIQPASPNMADLIAGANRLILPAVAMWLTWRAVAVLPASLAGRWLFWAVTSGGWLAVVLLAIGRYQSPSHVDDRLVLLLAGICAVIFPVWAALKTRAFPTWNGVRDAAAGTAILALAGAMFVNCYDARTHSIAVRAETRWAEIGLPMADFEKTLTPVVENTGSEVVRKVLREQVGTRFYKEGTPAAEREPVVPPSPEAEKLVKGASLMVGTPLPPADEMDLSKLPISDIESHAEALDAAYRRILTAEPAAWACNPADGYSISVPNFLGVRKFSQLTAADAMRRFATGDQEGAARAIAAGLRLREGLDRNPTLVSLMIRVAVDGLFAPQQAHLPATGESMQALARDVATMNVELLKRLQIEGWAALRFADQTAADPTGFRACTTALPEWAGQIANRHVIRRQLANADLNNAEHAAIRKSPDTLALADFGASLHEAVSAKNPTPFDVNVTRAAMRIYATLLLREQAELIRDARARLAAGRPVESRDSVVLPRLRWELTPDVEKHTVALRLANAPKWIAEHVVTPDEFWLLPLDGHIAWQFRPAASTVAAAP